ncbi:hypothetical protein QFC20_007186 [Naganishia adeliensis]|uniref:Uncharacterized protein n=1 Tax=Naganishia adeliensis TaxID=92952 RepID=A0ACC2V1K2_9TREE|nr:hypothetical protein QFC20_007186 [Naganishia adeliensis]
MAQEEEHTHRDVEMMYVQESIVPPNGPELQAAKRLRVEELGMPEMRSTLPRCVALRSRIFYQANDHMTDIEESEEEDLPFFIFGNTAGDPQEFLTRHLLHFAGTDPNSASVIDFLNSQRGFGLRQEPESVRVDGRDLPIRSRILTIQEASDWFGRDATPESIAAVEERVQTWNFEIILGMILEEYEEPIPDPGQEGWYKHAYMVIIIGASHRIPLQIWYADPLWDKDTELEDGTLEVLNYDRIANVDTEEHEQYLRTNAIRATILETLRKHFGEDGEEWLTEDQFPRRWLRITSYNDHGSAITLCRAAAVFMQRPYYFCGNVNSVGRDGGMIGPEIVNDPNSKLNRLWRGCETKGGISDRQSGFQDGAEAAMIAFCRISMARDARDYRRENAFLPMPAERFRFNMFFNFDTDELTTELQINTHLYPTITQAAWQPYLFIMNSDLRLLFHAVFGDPPVRRRSVARYPFRQGIAPPSLYDY